MPGQGVLESASSSVSCACRFSRHFGCTELNVKGQRLGSTAGKHAWGPPAPPEAPPETPPLNCFGLVHGSDGKESTCNAGDLGSIPELGRSPGGGHGSPLQYSCLENPHGQRSLVGHSPRGHKESDTIERLSGAQHMHKVKDKSCPFHDSEERMHNWTRNPSPALPASPTWPSQ